MRGYGPARASGPAGAGGPPQTETTVRLERIDSGVNAVCRERRVPDGRGRVWEVIPAHSLI